MSQFAGCRKCRGGDITPLVSYDTVGVFDRHLLPTRTGSADAARSRQLRLRRDHAAKQNRNQA